MKHFILVPAAILLVLLPALVRLYPAHRMPTAGREAASLPAATRPAPPDRRVLIISIDGLRPDLLLRIDAPHIRRLITAGASTFWAHTVDESYTLPAHVSMLTGVVPERHGVTWNNHIEEAYPSVPTLFSLAKEASLTTALAVGKTKFVALTPPESLDWKFQPMNEPTADAAVAEQAVTILREHRPNVLFVHFAAVDAVGHEHGWGSPRQREALVLADAAVGKVVAATDELKLNDSTLFLLTSDHGGAGRVHRPGDVRSRHIPWVAVGPGIRAGLDLTSYSDLTIRTEDTFATACSWLDLKLPPNIDGKPIHQIFLKTEFLEPAP